jgi:hypothetical protein
MKENSIRRAVREGRAALGTGLKEFASRGVPWIIEASGFDYCTIDHEHGAFDLETIADLAGWFQATDVSAIVRIHKSFTHLIPLGMTRCGRQRRREIVPCYFGLSSSEASASGRFRERRPAIGKCQPCLIAMKRRPKHKVPPVRADTP